MSLHDIFTRSSRDRARRRRLGRRGLGLPGLPRWPGDSVRATPHGLRRLAAIDRALAVETPRLAGMFAMFNQLAGAEPVGAERLPARAWPRPRVAHVAVLATLAVIVAITVALSTQLHGVMRTCLSSAPTSSTASSTASSTPPLPAPGTTARTTSATGSSAASPPASPLGGRAGPAFSGSAALTPLRYLSCQAYATTNK
jgi:hypothetical protein